MQLMLELGFGLGRGPHLTDCVAQVDPGRVARAEWTQFMFQRERRIPHRAASLGGCKDTGLQQLSPMEVPSKRSGMLGHA